MLFYLGTHETSWLGRTDIGVPLFLSARRLRRRRPRPARVPWALDSGGFTELGRHGRWMVSQAQYADEICRWSTAGRLDWVAPQDWMCEPRIRAMTGATVEQHQNWTIESVAGLRGRNLPTRVIPVLQGWDIGDYARHVRMYERAGFDLAKEPVVGVGSVCRRQSTKEGAAIMTDLAGYGLRLHAFGFKKQGLRSVGHLLHSADSMAWSAAARWRPPMPGYGHKTCANCRKWALEWRRQTVGEERPTVSDQLALPLAPHAGITKRGSQPTQTPLFGVSAARSTRNVREEPKTPEEP